MKWENLEHAVRAISEYKWNARAEIREVNGVRLDCLLVIRPDYWVVVEVTKEKKLSKLRTDLAKFASVRPYLFSKQIYAECYFVSESEPPESLPETGRGQNVSVLSLSNFEKAFFDYQSYQRTRSARKFGSAVDPSSGDKDNKSYVPVKYLSFFDEREYSIEGIGKILENNGRIVLLGNYGTGKSRCIQELFGLLGNTRQGVFYPIAIDLRDNWGTRRGHELIQRHFDELGLNQQAQQIIKIIETASPCFLLDGFDEIGAQAWSGNPHKLPSIRADSLAGVRDLIARTKGGVIITGREHYFNSDEEMFECLGLAIDDTTIIKCADEFTDQEMRQYLAEIAPNIILPTWIPRRPLICQIISDMDAEALGALEKEKSGEVSFWQIMIRILCEREARIKQLLDAETIREVLRRVARVTRSQPSNFGPISTSDINRAFESVTGLPPTDESAVILQRLPGLGRLASESTDRQFIDSYILDGLRAEDVIDLSETQDVEVLNERWVNPLLRFGVTLLSNEIATTVNYNGFFRLMRQAAARQNKILAGEIMSGLLCSSDDPLDFGNLELTDAHIYFLDFSRTAISGLMIRDSIIDIVDVTECQVDNVQLHDCIIQQVYGVTAEKGLPEWMHEIDAKAYEAVNNVARIRQAKLSQHQRIFLTIIKKLFFQPGAGRKEEALLRGLGIAADKKISDRIIKTLMAENIIERFKGREGWVYKPNRVFARRMDRILTTLTLSADPIWLRLAD